MTRYAIVLAHRGYVAQDCLYQDANTYQSKSANNIALSEAKGLARGYLDASLHSA
jgi:hypothetical protein